MDKNTDSSHFTRDLETRFFQMAQATEGADGSREAADVHGVLEFLKSNLGFTTGLCKELKRSLASVPIRFWLVDNSGSMRAKDYDTSKILTKFAHSRWDELRAIVAFLADFAEALHARTDIHFLNQPGATGNGVLDIHEFRSLVKFYGFNESNLKEVFNFYDVNKSTRLSAAELIPALQSLRPVGSPPIDVRTANTLLHQFDRKVDVKQLTDMVEWPEQFLSIAHDTFPRLPPYGVAAPKAELLRSLGPKPKLQTPLHLRLKEITKMVELIAPELTANGQVAALVIWTDGVPDKKALFVKALEKLQRLPVTITVRLCTSDDDVIEYFDTLDTRRHAASAAPRAPMDVLDDLVSEAREVGEAHPWLTYAAPLHMLREFGVHNPIFDQLDERKMSPEQMHAMLCMLLGDDARLPEPTGQVQAWPWAIAPTTSAVPPTAALETAHPGTSLPITSATYTSDEWPTFVAALSAALSRAPMVMDPVRRSWAPWVDVSKLSAAYGPCLVLRVGGAQMPTNAFVTAEATQAGDSRVLATTELLALAGSAELTAGTSYGSICFAVRSHSSADPAMWPELRIARTALVEATELVLHVFAWDKREKGYRRLDTARPKLVSSTAPISVAALLSEMGSGAELPVGSKTLVIAEACERSALEQDVRDKAAWDAVAAEERRRVREFQKLKTDKERKAQMASWRGETEKSSACVLL